MFNLLDLENLPFNVRENSLLNKKLLKIKKDYDIAKKNNLFLPMQILRRIALSTLVEEFGFFLLRTEKLVGYFDSFPKTTKVSKINKTNGSLITFKEKFSDFNETFYWCKFSSFGSSLPVGILNKFKNISLKNAIVFYTGEKDIGSYEDPILALPILEEEKMSTQWLFGLFIW